MSLEARKADQQICVMVEQFGGRHSMQRRGVNYNFAIASRKAVESYLCAPYDVVAASWHRWTTLHDAWSCCSQQDGILLFLCFEFLFRLFHFHCFGFLGHESSFSGIQVSSKPTEDLQHRALLESHPCPKIFTQPENAGDVFHHCRDRRG